MSDFQFLFLLLYFRIIIQPTWWLGVSCPLTYKPWWWLGVSCPLTYKADYTNRSNSVEGRPIFLRVYGSILGGYWYSVRLVGSVRPSRCRGVSPFRNVYSILVSTSFFLRSCNVSAPCPCEIRPQTSRRPPEINDPSNGKKEARDRNTIFISCIVLYVFSFVFVFMFVCFKNCFCIRLVTSSWSQKLLM
mgnify:CR=1 FL=1